MRRRALVLLPCLIPCHRCETSARNLATLTIFDHATWQHTRESPRHVREAARINDIRTAQFVLRIEKSSHIMGPRGSQDLRSSSLIMAPVMIQWFYDFTCIKINMIFARVTRKNRWHVIVLNPGSNQQLVHALACTIELWSTREVWRARKKRKSCPRR